MRGDPLPKRSPEPLVVVAGAHLGYDLREVPLGGGAAVMRALVRRWSQQEAFPLVVLGAGPGDTWEGLEYHPIPWYLPEGQRITDFSVRAYARFSLQFGRGVLDFLRDLARRAPPQETVVIHNDISEAADFAAVAKLGYRQVAIFHVDVLDYVANIYLRGRIGAPSLARMWRYLGRFGRFFPLVIRLILEKQERCARHCDLLVVPSREMADLLRREYPWLGPHRVRAVPWGALIEGVPREEVEREKGLLVRDYLLDGSRPVLLALSRISPEKGQDLLLRALRLWDRREKRPLLAFICGEPAFMHGRRYMRRLLALSKGLRHVEVHFPGYVTGARKQAFFELADLYVFPSRHESYGLTLMEAMGAGLPVLTTTHRSAGELVREGWGRIVPPTPEGIYRGLRELLGEDLASMGEAARRFAATRPFEAAADELARLIRSLVAGA